MDALTDPFFYPNILQLKVGGVWVDQFHCGDQPNNTGGNTVNTVERIDYIYQSLVFFPKGASNHRFLPGEEIQIVDTDGRIRVSGKVARFDVGGLEDNRIWI